MVMDKGYNNSISQNYTYYNGNIELPRVNKFSSPTSSPTHTINVRELHESPRSPDDADNSNLSDDKLSPKRNIDDTQPLFVPQPPSVPKTKTRAVKAQIHNQLKTNNKVTPYIPPLVHSSRLPPIDGKAPGKHKPETHSDSTSANNNNREFIEKRGKGISSENTDTPRSGKSNSDNSVVVIKEDGLRNEHHLINEYKDFINKRYTEETLQENLNDSSSSEDEFSVSVSSLSEDGDDGEKTLTTTGFEPLYSLPMKKKKQTDNFLNKILISNSSTNNSENPYLRTGCSLPDLRSVDKFNLKRVSHVVKNESEAESEPGAQIGYKFKPLPPIPGTKSNISCNSGLYETIDGLSKLNKSSNNSNNVGNDKERPKRKTFKDIATILTLVPRLTTNSVRSRTNDHHLANITQYLPNKKLKIFVGTWNMKGTKFLPSSLDDFLLPPESIYLQDVYVIGTQEGTPFKHEWQVRLQETFGPSHVLMQASNFGVLQLSVFVRRELVWFCSSVEQDTIATRIGHTIKTKGALAMSFSIFGTSLLFITSHFTSDTEKLDQRLNDYRTICQSIQLPYGDAKDTEKDVTNRFDRVFWFGDFNFRIQKPRAYVDKMLKKHSQNDESLIGELMQHDQLNELFVKGKIFHGFTESPIHFMPTYKFDVNTAVYDTSSKQRVPSWTDRILHKSAPTSSLSCLYYNSCNSIKVSDHRPVYGIYEVEVQPYKNNFTVTGANFDREVYVEANLRRNAPNGSQSNSHVCTIL